MRLAAFVLGSRRVTICQEDFSNTTTITQRMQIPKNPKFLFDFPYYTVKQFYYKLSLFSTTMLKNLGSRNGGSRSAGGEFSTH